MQDYLSIRYMLESTSDNLCSHGHFCNYDLSSKYDHDIRQLKKTWSLINDYLVTISQCGLGVVVVCDFHKPEKVLNTYWKYNVYHYV